MNAPVQADLLETRQRSQSESFHEYLRVVFRHRYSILGLTLAFCLLGLLRAALEVPIFRSSALLQISPTPVRYVEMREIMAPFSTPFEYYQTQYEILRTSPLARRTVEIVGAERILQAYQREGALSLSKLMPWLAQERTAPLPTGDAAVAQATGTVLGAMRIEPIRNSQLVRIAFEVPDVQLAADLANALAKAYIESSLNARLQMVRDASEWIQDTSKELRANLEQAEARLQAFKERHGIVGAGASLSAQQMSALNLQITEASTRRIAREAAYREVIEAERNGRALETLPTLLLNPGLEGARSAVQAAERTVAQLSNRYGPNHPEMVRARTELEAAQNALRSQARSVAASIKSEYELARQIEQQLIAQREATNTRAVQESGLTIQLTQLEREVESARQLYEKLQTQFKETSQAQSMDTSNARIVEPAAGGGQVYPNYRRSAILAGFIGLILSVALAFLLEHLDSTIKTAEDVERRLDLPVMGLVPRLKTSGRSDHSPLRYFLDHPKTGFAESVRTLRTNVLLSAIDKPHKRLLVTSSVPGEGKTTLSVNLALSLAQMQKVLLIDADMRRPTVSKVLPNPPQMGLSQYIAGEAKISDCVTQLEHTNTYVMTAGVIPPNPLELLSSNKFADALDSLGKVFDYIVIDCAPALAVSDALVLSRLVDGVIYVVRCDATPHQAAASGVKRLRRVDAPLLGAVLNRVGERTHGYGYGRYAYYADGYYPHYGYYQQNEPAKSRRR